jgi:hypothetical protein
MTHVYVIRVAFIPEEEKDNPPFEEEETKYTSIDMETMAHAPILSDILLTLKNLHYSFDKYCTAHVDQHNCHAALAEWNVKPLEETMKIHYFEGEITDPSFASVKRTIMVDHQKFQDFDAVMQLYVNYKRLQKAETPTHQAHNVSALQGHGGGRQGCGGHGRGGQGGLGGRLSGGVPKEEVNKVTTVEAKWYSTEDCAKFTPAKKQKHFQLMQAKKAARNSGMTNNSSAAVAELTTAISAVSAAALAISERTAATTKRTAAECGETNNNDAIVEPEWGCNRSSPASAGRQEHVPKKPKT